MSAGDREEMEKIVATYAIFQPLETNNESARLSV